MKKEVHVKFDREAYEEYLELKKNVEENKNAKKPPSYEQLLKSIEEVIEKSNSQSLQGRGNNGFQLNLLGI